MKGYKAFNRDWTCKGFQYEIGKTFTYEGKLIFCESGFHFCTSIEHCFDFYDFDPNLVRIAEIEAVGDIIRGHNAYVTNKIKITKELKWDEVCTLINDGCGNVGFANNGCYNYGHRNNGKGNRGASNKGDDNDGFYNFGFKNSGIENIGRLNFGTRNIGWRNYGCYNIGCFNLGSYNIGVFNIGFSKNKSLISKINEIFGTIRINVNVKNLCFYQVLNAVSKNDFYYALLTSDYIKDNVPFYMFNKKSTWTMDMWNKSKARLVLSEKIHIDDERVAGTYPQKCWDSLSEDDKNEILSLPNFNAKIFEQITGIKVK